MRRALSWRSAPALVLVLAVAAGVVGVRRARLTDADRRRSTFLAGPSGRARVTRRRSSGWASGSRRSAARRRRSTRSPRRARWSPFLGPTRALGAARAPPSPGSTPTCCSPARERGAALRCLGYDVASAGRDSSPWHRRRVRSARPFPAGRADAGPRGSATWPWIRRRRRRRAGHAAPRRRASAVDTLLRTTDGRPVVLRAALADGRTVTLVADDRLFPNRALRETAAGPFVLGLVVPRYDRVVVDEYHHGFDASRSRWRARRSPGAAGRPGAGPCWQLAGVGRARAARGRRPVRPGPAGHRAPAPLAAGARARARHRARRGARPRRRRCGLIVQGLRRRLSPRGPRRAARELGAWLAGLAPPSGRRAAATALDDADRRSPAGRPAPTTCCDAADAVENLWEELTPT